MARVRVLLSFFLLGCLLPVESSVHISTFEELSNVPSRIFFTDGTDSHFGLALNAAKNYLSLGGNPEQFFVLVYNEYTRVYLQNLNINTLYFPEILEELEYREDLCIRAAEYGKPQWMARIMELRFRIWLELCRLEKQFVVFDSDTVFYEHPDFLFEKSLSGVEVDIVAAYFLGKGMVENTADIIQENYILDGVGEGKFELNFSPSAIINPKKMYPILSKMFDIVHEQMAMGCEKWGWGWGQVLPNVILYESGLRWRQDEAEEMAMGEWAFKCSKKDEFCLDRESGVSIREEREESVGKWAGITLKNHFFTHYAGDGGWSEKAFRIALKGDWFLPCQLLHGGAEKWKELISSSEFLMNPEEVCAMEDVEAELAIVRAALVERRMKLRANRKNGIFTPELHFLGGQPYSARAVGSKRRRAGVKQKAKKKKGARRREVETMRFEMEVKAKMEQKERAKERKARERKEKELRERVGIKWIVGVGKRERRRKEIGRLLKGMGFGFVFGSVALTAWKMFGGKRE